MTPSKTPFAGFERLAPGDPLSSDGYAFQFENPLIADLLARIGAVTHRHDGHAAMADPTADPTVTTAASGGSIPSGLAIHVAYTLTDGDGGESLPSPAVVVSTASGYSTPASPPTAVVDYTAGTLLAGTPLYAVTVTDGVGGETALGPAAAVTIDPGHANARVNISGLTALTDAASGGSSTAGWRMWRSVDGGSTWNLMATGPHSSDTWTDTGSSAGDCTVDPPSAGTTVGANKLTVTVPSAGQPSDATFFSIYADITGQFLSPCLLGTYPVADFDSPKVYTALALQNGQPPAVSRCYPGANQIDPATDILGGGGGGGSSPTGPALGINRVELAAPAAIAASGTTNILIPVPAWAEAQVGRIVIGLCIEHADASHLAVSINNPALGGAARLFTAGSFSAVANVGNPATAPDDPESVVYFTDSGYGNMNDFEGAWQPTPLLTDTSALGPYGGINYVPRDAISSYFYGNDTAGDWTLAITESGGHTGTLKAAILYFVSTEFDSLLQIPAPPNLLAWTNLLPAANMSAAAPTGVAVGAAGMMRALGHGGNPGPVLLRGALTATGAVAAGTSFATLPAANAFSSFFPFYKQTFPALAQIGGVMTPVVLTIAAAPAGTLSINAALASGDVVFLDGLSYQLDT